MLKQSGQRRCSWCAKIYKKSAPTRTTRWSTSLHKSALSSSAKTVTATSWKSVDNDPSNRQKYTCYFARVAEHEMSCRTVSTSTTYCRSSASSVVTRSSCSGWFVCLHACPAAFAPSISCSWRTLRRTGARCRVWRTWTPLAGSGSPFLRFRCGCQRHRQLRRGDMQIDAPADHTRRCIMSLSLLTASSSVASDCHLALSVADCHFL